MGGGEHGHSHSHGHAGNSSTDALDYVIPQITPDSSYFTHEGYSNVLVAHVIFMTLAWVFALPISMWYPSSPAPLCSSYCAQVSCSVLLGRGTPACRSWSSSL